ncbi:MAG: hypothetical protein AABZ06_12055 [Bdellovibrionota bacterium]
MIRPQTAIHNGFIAVGLLAGLFYNFQIAMAGGGWTGNGGDHLRDQQNAWFLGTEPVSYCVLRAPDFPLGDTEIDQMIESALSDWRIFFHKYSLDESTIGKNPRLGIFPDHQARGLSLNFKKIPTCPQEPAEEVVFLFGVTTPVIDEAIQHGAQNSIGLAVRKDYNHQTYRSGGYVWTKTFTSDPGRIKHVLLHELGHVFGMKHDSVYVMDSRVADLVDPSRGTRIISKPLLVAIESPNWKYAFRPGEIFSLTWEAPESAFRIPWQIKEDLRLSATDTYSATFSFKEKFTQFGLYAFNLDIESPGHEKTSLTLYMNRIDVSEAQSYSPGVFTRYKIHSSTPKESWFFQGLDNQSIPRSFIGYVNIGTRRYAAVLHYIHGPTLRIFGTQEGQWWGLPKAE